MTRVEILKEFYDLQADKMRPVGEVLELTDERVSELLVKLPNYVKVVDDEDNV